MALFYFNAPVIISASSRQEAITLILSAANTFPARNAENAVSSFKISRFIGINYSF